MVLPYIFQQQIYPLNTKYMPHMQIILCAHMRQLCHYICLISTQCNQQCDQMHWYTLFTLLAYAPKQICLYIKHIYDTAPLL